MKKIKSNKNQMESRKFLFTKDILLGAAVSYMKEHIVFKNYGFKVREYDDFTVIVAEQMPEATQLTEPELMAWKEMRVAGGM